MYIPHHFKNEDLSEVKSFLKSNSFGILLNNNPQGRIIGAHIPLELELDRDGKEVIYGHVAKANPIWNTFSTTNKVLAIFNGPHAYVSSSWYNHDNVSTWNYIAVHIYGTINVIDEEELKYSLGKLVNKYEANIQKPEYFEDMSESTMKQIKGIVGFKIRIEEIQAAYKLSQNRNDEDYQNVIKELENMEREGDGSLAKKMKTKR